MVILGLLSNKNGAFFGSRLAIIGETSEHVDCLLRFGEFTGSNLNRSLGAKKIDIPRNVVRVFFYRRPDLLIGSYSSQTEAKFVQNRVISISAGYD